jgi:hypothetical protein
MTLSPVMSASTTALIRMTRPTVCLRVTLPLRFGPSDGPSAGPSGGASDGASGRDSSDTGLTFDGRTG